jgi:acetyl esterase/lipase
VALNEVVDVYCSLVSGAAADLLGIDVDRVIVTGESAGGNLAASLCVKLCMENLVDVDALTASNQCRDDSSSPEIDSSSRAGELEHESGSTIRGVRLPDAIMLSCPALNLTLELSPSRVLGNEDPVLPSGLISAISDAYIPPALGVSKKNPLASPFYAPDDVIRVFPPTLIFAGSDDPLLDDSIYFNRRLQSLGVESELRAASHMPHAYWGLGTAGFPEAKQVQHECEEWLVRQLAK